MTARRAAGPAWSLVAAAVAAALVLLALGAGERTPGDAATFGGVSGVTLAAAALAYATVGALVAVRAPANAIGWLLLGTGVVLGLGDLGAQVAERAVFGGAGAAGPGALARLAAWAQELASGVMFGLLALVLLLFPDGRLPSRRWRPVLALAAGGLALTVLSVLLRPGPLSEPYDVVVSPFGVPGTRPLADALTALGFFGQLAALAASGLGLPARVRRARGLQREQLQWLALAAAVSGTAVVADLAAFLLAGAAVGTLEVAFLAFPLATGAAILRHGLFDVELVVNRALVYGALTLALGGAYLGSVLLLQLVLAPVTSGSQLAVAGSTLAAAGLFRPARGRIQRVVDRRFFRARYDAARTLAAFSARARREVDLAALSAELEAVVEEALRPAHVGLWLREDGG